MRRLHDPHSYPLSYYDHHTCLKPPLFLWVAVLYLSRAITLPVAMAIGHFAGVDPRAVSAFRALWSLDGLLPSLIAAVVLYAMCRRVPTAATPVRWIWARGRIFLGTAAVFDIALLLAAFIRERSNGDLPLSSLFAAVGDMYFLLYILTVRRVRDAFGEFPAPLESPESENIAGRPSS